MEQQDQSLFDLQLDQQSISYLSEGARWARFIAIVGFIFCGLMVILAFFVGTIFTTVMSSTMGAAAGFTGLGGGFITFMYIVFAAIGFIPCLFLYRFGSRLQLAVSNNQQDQMHIALKGLKSYFKFIGILFIIYISFCVLGVIGAVIGGLAMR